MKQVIEKYLDEMAQIEDGLSERHEYDQCAAIMILESPSMAEDLVAHLGATDLNAPELDEILSLLSIVLDEARTAQENQRKKGAEFVQAITEAVGLAVRQGKLSVMHRLMLATCWGNSGLPAPDELQIVEEKNHNMDCINLEDSINELLYREAELFDGDAFELYGSLSSFFPAMQPKMREHFVAKSIEQAQASHVLLACFWLLDQAPSIRLAAAAVLASRAAEGNLSASIATRMALLRSWMPKDEALATVDKILKQAMRAGYAATAQSTPWKIHNVFASVLDRNDSQSILIALQSGKRRKTGVILTKAGHGVKECFTIRANSANEQRGLIQEMGDDIDAIEVSVSWLKRALATALADGLEAGLPPAPGLLEMAELCGFSDLRPEPVTTEAIIDALPAAERICSLSAHARGKLIDASEDWMNRHYIIGGWHDSSDGASDVIKANHSDQLARDSALWNWLETRRDKWSRLIALTANFLAEAKHPDADSFAATAMAMREGRDLKHIPIMAYMHSLTIERWAGNNVETPPRKES